jgi:plasmid stabilization system protein ParE
MNFRVIWTRAARDQLAAIWLSHSDRTGVTAAAHRIDGLLGRDPANQGEDRPNNRRIMFESPLVVVYRIDTANSRVIVSHVRQY